MSEIFKPELRNEVLRAPPAANASRIAVSAITRKDIVYQLPDGATENDRFAFFASLVLRGTSTSINKEHWRAFILTILHLAFPAVTSKMISDQPRHYTVLTCSPETVTALHTFIEMWKVWDEIPATNADDKKEGVTELAQIIVPFEHLPDASSANIIEGIRSSMTAEAMYGYVSIVLFLAGKTITDQNRGAITTRRPSAIERKYDLGQVGCLSGALRLSNIAHRMIHTGFVTMNHARSMIFAEIARFSYEKGDYGVEVVATTTRLMAYSGMQHVVLIDRFLSSDPDAAIIPILASSLVAYASSMEALRKTPVELRPFYKLIHGDTVREFNRKDVEPLMVVAIKTEAETNPTLANYNLPENNAEIMNVYRKYKDHIAHAE